MSTSPVLYPQYQPANYSTSQYGYSNSTNPNQLAQNQRSVVQNTGNNLMTADEDQANQYAEQQAGTQAYTNPIEETNAAGGGGYTPGQASQIQLTPAQQQNIVTNAGISAGQGTAAAVGGAERAAAAAGGSPAALATYRARAAQQQAAATGNAETGASVAAQQAASQGAQAVGNARLASQNQGLSYLSGLQQEQGQESQNEQGLSQGAYGTQTSGTSAAANLGLAASQTPSTFDKTIGAVSGALGALADGSPGVKSYLSDGMEAVVGEDGPELIVQAASDPVRSHTHFMDDGGEVGGITNGVAQYMAGGGDYGGETNTPDPILGGAPTLPPAAGQMPGGTNGDYGGETSNPSSAGTPSNSTGGGPINWLQRYLHGAAQAKATPAQPPQWNKETPYSQLGTGIGNVARMAAPYLADGDGGGTTNGFLANGRPIVRSAAYRSRPAMMADGQPDPAISNPVAPAVAPAIAPPVSAPPQLITSPTRVNLAPGDQVVPLTFRPHAKVRPSVAVAALKKSPLATRVAGLRRVA